MLISFLVFELAFILFKITNDKKQELLHRSNILLSFKSLKESLTDSNNVAKNNIDNNEEQVIGDKDL